ncbi:MAG: SiaC family regulatory phosphoprotein [Bacteroidia bacterium]
MTLHLSPTLHTPEVIATLTPLRIVLRGVCFPNDSTSFFESIQKFIEDSAPALRGKTLEIHLELEYMNSSSQRELFNLIRNLVKRELKVCLICYEGQEEEFDDLRHLLMALEGLSGVEIEKRAGYYQADSSAQEAPPGKS